MVRALRLCLVISMFALTGCENGNLFGKIYDRGESGDVQSLNADASNALREKNYSQALSLFEAVLAKDPNNSVALKGAATAAIGLSGLNFGQLVANILSQTSAPSIHDLNDLVAAAREVGASATADPNSILYGVNLDALAQYIDTAICRLRKITSGSGDNVVPATDIAAMTDLACLYLLRAILAPLRADFFDIRSQGGEYTLVEGAGFAGMCGGGNQATIEQIGQDLASAYVLFNRAASVLNISGSSMITQLRDDIADIVVELLDEDLDDDLGAGCVTFLRNIGIEDTTFQSYNGPFTPPSGDCN